MFLLIMEEHIKRGWIFVCTNRTERECFENMLFGDQDREEYRSRFENIEIGDGAFLYNLDREKLYGFYVIKEKGRNLEPQKWGGRFPLQVRVELQTHYQLACDLTKKRIV